MTRPRLLLLLIFAFPSWALAQTAVEVQVTPTQLRLKVGQREKLFLSAYDATGNLVAEPTFTFGLSQPGIVRVEQDGTVIGVAPGSARVEVKSGTGKAAVAVTVTGPPRAPAPVPAPEPVPELPPGSRLVPTPDSLRLLRLETGRVSMALVTPGGSGLGQVQVGWRSESPDVVSIDDSGEVTALQFGQTRVVATGPGGLTGVVPVEVRDDSLAVSSGALSIPVTGIDSIQVSVPAQGGRPITNGLAWRSSDSTIIEVSRDGVVYGKRPGEAYMLLTGFGQQRAVRVTVHPSIDRLRVAPAPSAPIRLLPGASAPFTLQALSADSIPIADATYRWEVSDTTVASFDPVARRLTARGLGRTTLTMTAIGFEPMVWEVDVTAGGLAFQRARFRLAPGAHDSLRVELIDGDNRPVGSSSEVQYSIDRPEVASVTAGGVVTATAVGGARITAQTLWGTSAVTQLYVTDDLLLSVRRGAGVDLVQLDPDDAGSLVPVLSDGNLNQQPVWSPDGTRIAFSATVNGNADIYAMDADGKNVTRLTTAPEADTEPAWSPDGGSIAFTSERGGTTDIWIMNADGSGTRPLTSGAGSNSSPAFRPDGRMISFISTRDGNADLFEMGSDGADPRAITRTPEPESFPAYFPNGDLAVTVERPGHADILRIRAGDGQRIMLQSMPGRITSLAIAGDGAVLAFSLSEPGPNPMTTPIRSFQFKSLTPDLPPAVLSISGDVLSASFQGAK